MMRIRALILSIQEDGQQNNNLSDKDDPIPPSGTVDKDAEDLSSQIYASSARVEGIQKSTATTEGQNKDAVDAGKPLNLYFLEFCYLKWNPQFVKNFTDRIAHSSSWM